MADKEERIAIVKWNTKDSICPVPTELQCGGAKSCEDCKVGMSRKEAIVRMTKAICKFEMMTERHICKECREECFEHLELEVVDKAEAALNALLSSGE